MSDKYLKLIPTDHRWQPAPAAATAAESYVLQLFSGPGDDVEDVDYHFHDRITLIDAGSYTTEIDCSRCGERIDLEWYDELIEADNVSFDDLDVTVPCCGAVVGLDTLHFDLPIGFARFELTARNPTRASVELDATELAALAGLLGHPVTQLVASY